MATYPEPPDLRWACNRRRLVGRFAVDLGYPGTYVTCPLYDRHGVAWAHLDLLAVGERGQRSDMWTLRYRSMVPGIKSHERHYEEPEAAVAAFVGYRTDLNDESYGQ